MNTAVETTPVQKGAEVLDRLVPGWALRINLDLLDMQETKYCIVGQLWPEGGWIVNATNLCRLIDPERLREYAETFVVYDPYQVVDAIMTEHGFEIPNTTPDESYDSAYRALAHLWREEISKRV